MATSKLVRSRSGLRGTGNIGVVGFSASGHLAVYSMVHPDPNPELNPDFAILAYGISRLNPTNRD